MLPPVIVFSIIKESGPVITGLVVAGRAGAGIGAELGSMKVTEQIDAMEASAVDPYKFLAATRVLAGPRIAADLTAALAEQARGTTVGGLDVPGADYGRARDVLGKPLPTFFESLLTLFYALL